MVKTTAIRLVYFHDLLTRITDVEGDIVECGVGWGRSLFAFCTGVELSENERHIWGFDSFEGFPDPTEEDEPERFGLEKGRYATTADGVQRYLLNSGVSAAFLEQRVTLVKGFFEDTLTQYSGDGIALLHLDVDLYQSYRDCLETLFPLVRTGGIVAFDEYHETGKYRAAKLAIDEYLAGREQVVRSPIGGRYFLRKSS